MNTNYPVISLLIIVVGLLIAILIHLKGITLDIGNLLEFGLWLLALWLLEKLLGKPLDKLFIICQRVSDYFAVRWWIAPISVIAVGVSVLALTFMGR